MNCDTSEWTRSLSVLWSSSREIESYSAFELATEVDWVSDTSRFSFCCSALESSRSWFMIEFICRQSCSSFSASILDSFHISSLHQQAARWRTIIVAENPRLYLMISVQHYSFRQQSSVHSTRYVSFYSHKSIIQSANKTVLCDYLMM